MMRYLRLYAKFLEFSFGRAMEFRIDFYFRIFMDLMFYAVNIAFFKVIYMHSSDIGGWNEQQAMIFVAGYITVDAIQMTLFSNNMWVFPQLINKGDLDYYLVRPVSSFFMLNFRDFAVNSFINLLISIGILTWALVSYSEPLGVLRVFNFLLLIINGTFLFHLIRLLFILPVFWTHSSRGFDTIFWTIGKFAERPHGIFKGYVKLFFFTLLPLSVIASLPTESLFTEAPLTLTLYCLLVMFAVFIAVQFVWIYALRNYSSASS